MTRIQISKYVAIINYGLRDELEVTQQGCDLDDRNELYIYTFPVDRSPNWITAKMFAAIGDSGKLLHSELLLDRVEGYLLLGNIVGYINFDCPMWIRKS